MLACACIIYIHAYIISKSGGWYMYIISGIIGVGGALGAYSGGVNLCSSLTVLLYIRKFKDYTGI